MTESKIDAVLGPNQLEDYLKYGQWGKEKGLWKTAITVLMAPVGYLTKLTCNSCIQTISYEEIAEKAQGFGLQKLSKYLLAGIKRYQFTGEPRNPDEIVSAFRVRYAGLLREEYPDLYGILNAKGTKLFDSSQKWFYFKLKDNAEIVHKISNKDNKQNVNDEQYLSLHIPGMGTYLSELPDLNLCGDWRTAKSTSKNKSAIYEIPLSQKARMFFSSFDTDAALRVWDLATEVRQQWENQIYDSD